MNYCTLPNTNVVSSSLPFNGSDTFITKKSDRIQPSIGEKQRYKFALKVNSNTL